VPGEGGQGSKGAGRAAGDRAISGTTQDGVRSEGSSSTVGGADGLDSADEGGSAGMGVVHPHGDLVRVAGNVGVAADDNPRSHLIAGSCRYEKDKP